MVRTSHFGRFRKKPWAGLAGQEEQQRLVSLIAAVNAQDLSKAQEPHNRPSEAAQVER
jgi:hypothetical protein